MGQRVTLMVAGKPLTFTRVEGCMPPKVPVPKPGPCPGPRSPIQKAVRNARRAVKQRDESAKAARAARAKDHVLKLANGEKFDIHPEDVADLLAELGRDDAPPVNLANIQVSGKGNERMFQHHLRDIPRDKMPALPDNVTELMPFIQELGRRGIKAELIEVDPREIQATQSQLSGPKVAKMSGFMKSGWKPGGTTIVSQELALGDGHHRWAGAAVSALMHEMGVEGYKPVKMQALKVDLPIDELLAVMEEFSGPKKALTEKA